MDLVDRFSKISTQAKFNMFSIDCFAITYRLSRFIQACISEQVHRIYNQFK